MKKFIVIFLLTTATLSAKSLMAPAEGPTGIQFIVRLIEASNEPGAPNDAADEVPAELKNILKHTAYSQVGVAILRGRRSEFDLGSLVGEIDAKIIDRGGDQVIEFDLELSELKKIANPEEGGDDHEWRTIIETSDIARDGESVVLGASSIRGGAQAMIVLMTAKIIR